MGYRIMQLQYEPERRNILLKEGITLKQPFHVTDIGFAKIQSMYTPDHDLEVSTIHEFNVYEDGDGYKTIGINPPIDVEVICEEAIILIVHYADEIKTSEGTKRIAGRYSYEGIFLLEPNDQIIVTKGPITERFVAVQLEGELYLVKLRS